MVDSAHESVAALKAEVAELAADLDEARSAADAAERRLEKVPAAPGVWCGLGGRSGLWRGWCWMRG